MPIFEFERVSLSYSLRDSKRHVLQDLSFTVGDGGTVTLLQRSNTALRVASADAKAGWKVNVVDRNGTRPHVGFQRIGMPNDQERFWARMNTTGTPGTVINTVIQSCT